MTSPAFHAGELALQQRLGVRDRMAAVGQAMIRSHMPGQHRELFHKLPTLWLGTLDAQGRPWATVLTGMPGFMHSPDDSTLDVMASPDAQDPAAAGLTPGAPVGLLGLEPHTRRRNRMNGELLSAGAQGFTVRVRQSFGNCPKYIQARQPQPMPDRAPGRAHAEGPVLGAQALALVQASDTCFIASSSAATPRHDGTPGAGVDLSHRGGRPGFVQVSRTPAGHQLTLPDYAGNAMFNTLGNLLLWPWAGLLFVDWTSGDLLQLSATASLVQEGPALAAHPGAQRLLVLQVAGGLWRPAAVPLAWSAAQMAPQFQGG
ncbi:pyridoxamine 5'-phosphate oxidase family protein [Ideonella sp. DXS22W]|uniref:Pyridoxamine 5'-phosphate oxidase family protein n=1 Tax=Pseudaquabacterium inlustre TaxID=2984192 RepID=A0ABU9CLV9_9BURK